MKKDMCERIREIDTILEDVNLKSCFVIIAIIGVTFHRLRNMTYYDSAIRNGPCVSIHIILV